MPAIWKSGWVWLLQSALDEHARQKSWNPIANNLDKSLVVNGWNLGRGLMFLGAANPVRV